MPRIEIEFSNGRKEEISFEGFVVGIRISGQGFDNRQLPLILPKEDDTIVVEMPGIEPETIILNQPYPHNMKGIWLTDDQRTIQIYSLHESKKYWLGRCRDCGSGRDDLIYDLDGLPVNYPEYGKLMKRLASSKEELKEPLLRGPK